VTEATSACFYVRFGIPGALRNCKAPKQPFEKSTLIVESAFGAVIGNGAMALPIFYFKTGSDKLVNLIRDDQMTFAKLSINVIAWIGVPNETYDFQKNLAVSPKRRITCPAPKITFVALPAQGAPPNRFSCRALPARLSSQMSFNWYR
jgi:hypothetical protein